MEKKIVMPVSMQPFILTTSFFTTCYALFQGYWISADTEYGIRYRRYGIRYGMRKTENEILLLTSPKPCIGLCSILHITN